VAGCTPTLDDNDDDDDATSTPPEGCVEAESCDALICGDPTVEGGHGFGTFDAIEPGGDFVIGWGAQGGGCGYHLWVGAQTRNVCPIVYLDWDLEIDGVLVLDGPTRHVGLPEGPDGDLWFWGERLLLPVGLYPNDSDPDRTEFCPDDSGSIVPLNEATDVVLITTILDDDDRTATQRLPIAPFCCE